MLLQTCSFGILFDVCDSRHVLLVFCLIYATLDVYFDTFDGCYFDTFDAHYFLMYAMSSLNDALMFYDTLTSDPFECNGLHI